MTSTATIVTMSSTGSNSPIPMDVEEPRKKGSRGGKRSVTHLSKAQLARKRANDREAQRNIRQRTKEHIENLERKVKELEQGSRSGSIERVLQRNRELEEEVEKLRAQVSHHHTPIVVAQDLAEELLLPQQKVDWMPESTAWPQAVPHSQSMAGNADIRTSNPAYTTSNGQGYPATSSSMGFEDETSHHMYTTSETWGNPVSYSAQANGHGIPKTATSWSPIDTNFTQPSRFADMQVAGFSDGLSQQQQQQHNYSTSWQSQPSIYS